MLNYLWLVFFMKIKVPEFKHEISNSSVIINKNNMLNIYLFVF